jgi:hypothetical protein
MRPDSYVAAAFHAPSPEAVERYFHDRGILLPIADGTPAYSA